MQSRKSSLDPRDADLFAPLISPSRWCCYATVQHVTDMLQCVILVEPHIN